MKIILTNDRIVDQKLRKVEAIRDLPSGHVKKGATVLALHKMRVFVPVAGEEYRAIEMDGQLFDRYFKDLPPIVMI